MSKTKKMANIQKIGDELLTAFVNEEFEKVTQIWSKAGYETPITIIALHKYSNPNISSELVPHVVLKASEWMYANDPIWIAIAEEEKKAKIEKNDAERKLRSLGYDDGFCEVTGMTYWAKTDGIRIIEGDPRIVLELLK
jgi:hypothetical protein